MNLSRLICLFLLLTGMMSVVHADKYFFEQISINEGLSQSSVKAIYRDRTGMLWIGTKEGLNRYDGQLVHSYFHDTGQEHSLSDNNIYFITEDISGELWIGTGAAPCRYNRGSDTFIREQINGQDLSLRNIFVHGKYMYSTTGNSLIIYNAETKSWSEKMFSGDESNLTAASKIEYWDKYTLLIASRWKGLFFVDIRNGKLTRTPFYKKELILDIYRNEQGYIWISEIGKGLVCFDSKGEKKIDLQKIHSPYKVDKIMDVVDFEGSLWMVSDGEGVLTYTYSTGEIKRIDRQYKQITDVSANSLLTLYVDPYNNMWLGSIRGGLLGVRKIFVNMYGSVPLLSPRGLSDPTVLSFYNERKGIVWVGTDGQGINLYDVSSREFQHYPATFSTKVTAICGYSDRELLLGLYKDGLVVFDKRKGTIKPLVLRDNSGRQLFTSDWIGINLFSPDGKTIYIADEDVYAYTPANQSIKKITDFSSGMGSIRLHVSRYLPDEIIFFNNREIYTYHFKTGNLKRIFRVKDGINMIINAVDYDKNGCYWLGISNGLYKWIPQKTTLERLLSERIKSVSTLLIDTKESVWIGSGTSLYRYHIRHNQFFMYGKADGIISNEYLPKSRLLSIAGDVFLGGVSGFVQIEKDIPFPEDIVPGFELLDVQLDGSLLSPKRIRNKGEKHQIRLPWNHTSLQLNLFINTPSLATFPRCRYRIEGLNSAYQDLETQSIRLQTLPPGSYEVLTGYELKDKKWSDDIVLTTLYVMPPWWQTWWFYLIILLMVALVLFRARRVALRKARQSMEIAMQKHEQELSEQKIRFLINISHELRTPLTLIYAPLQRLLREEQVPDVFRPLLTLMYKHVKNMKNMIDMVLDVRKMEMKHERLNRTPNDVNTWIKAVSDDFLFELQSKKLSLQIESDDRIQTLSFDRERCDKVLSNLLMNAIKFSEEGSKIIVQSLLLEDKIRISVIDEGPGVSKEDIPNLFTRFYQTSNRKGGTGIGLSYAKEQVELHGGNVGYTPVLPHGSEFWFELPFEQVQVISENTFEKIMMEQQKGDLPEHVVFAETVDFSKLTVLIVEDEPDLLTYMYESLRGIFKKVITAQQGDEGLKKVHKFMPDLVISDVMMPVMDGFEFCRLLKTDVNISHIPVILLTALGGDESSLTGYKMGADLYLSKPFGIDLLLAILNNLLRTRVELKKRFARPELNVTTQEITFSNADEWFIAKLVELIEKRLDDADLRIDDLAAEMAMSRSSFYTKVKLVTGMSANAFVTDYKIKKVIPMLRDPRKTIQEIAMQVGFVNQRYFSTVFKQMTGKTPTQYRNEL